MKNEITVHNASLLQVIEDRSLGEIIKPLVNEIHLFDTYIAGTAYIENHAVFDTLKKKDRLKMRREDSKFDDNAILVLNENNEKLGYIPEKDNLIFSRLMDAGKLLVAIVDDIEVKGSFVKIRIGIYLIDY